MAIDFDSYFTQFGKAAILHIDLVDDVQGSVRTHVQNLLDALNSETPEVLKSVTAIPNLLTQLEDYVQKFSQTAYAASMQELLRQVVDADRETPTGSLSEALDEFLYQFRRDSESFDVNTVGGSSADVGSPVGDGSIEVSMLSKWGEQAQLADPEVIRLECIAKNNSTKISSFSLKSEKAISPFNPRWTGGSGLNGGLSTTAGGDGIASNGAFNDADTNLTDQPAYWYKRSGTGVITDVHVGRITFSGTPTAGTFTLSLTDVNGYTQLTEVLPYNATAALIEYAIRALPGYEQVTVAEVTPNTVWDVTFYGVPPKTTLAVTGNLTN